MHLCLQWRLLAFSPLSSSLPALCLCLSTLASPVLSLCLASLPCLWLLLTRLLGPSGFGDAPAAPHPHPIVPGLSCAGALSVPFPHWTVTSSEQKPCSATWPGDSRKQCFFALPLSCRSFDTPRGPPLFLKIMFISNCSENPIT